MNVCVLGGGPSGLLAAWAVIDAGHNVTIIDKKPRKPDGTTAGVYVLHDQCNLPVRESNVEVLVSGGRDHVERQLNYEKKVYMTHNSTPVSIPEFEHYLLGFDGMQALNFCWDIVSPFMEAHDVMDERTGVVGWGRVLQMAEHFDLVVNTIPMNVLLPDRAWHHAQATIYRNDAPAHESYMLYQANPSILWYRASAIFGQFTLEYPSQMGTMDKTIPRKASGQYVTVKKVINSPESMPELPENVMLTGRYGAWDKGKLSHHAYHDVMSRLQS